MNLRLSDKGLPGNPAHHGEDGFKELGFLGFFRNLAESRRLRGEWESGKVVPQEPVQPMGSLQPISVGNGR